MRTGPLFSPVEAFSAVVRDNFRVPYRVPSDCVKWGYTWSGFFQSSVRCVGGRVLCKASSEVPSGRVKWGYIRSGCSQFAGQLSSRIGAGAGAPVLLVALSGSGGRPEGVGVCFGQAVAAGSVVVGAGRVAGGGHDGCR